MTTASLTECHCVNKHYDSEMKTEKGVNSTVVNRVSLNPQQFS